MKQQLEKLEILLKEEIDKVPRPFGIFLSGGIDSSILAVLSKPDFAITCHFAEGRKYDEFKYAQIVANYLDIDLKVVTPQKRHFKDELEDAIKIIGEPINSISILPWYYLMRWTRGKNMLCGEGADELFGGYARYLIYKHIFELYDVEELKNYHPTLNYLFRPIPSKLVEAYIPETKNIEEVMKAEYETTLPNILYMEDKLAEHFKVVLFRPFMTNKIKEFAHSLPTEMKIKGWTTKVILRELAKKYLPKEIVERKDKMGLVAPVNKWMGWGGKRGEFDKGEYRKFQKQILGL